MGNYNLKTTIQDEFNKLELKTFPNIILIGHSTGTSNKVIPSTMTIEHRTSSEKPNYVLSSSLFFINRNHFIVFTQKGEQLYMYDGQSGSGKNPIDRGILKKVKGTIQKPENYENMELYWLFYCKK